MSEATDRLKHALRDRYAIEGELGEGGMATVYLAEDLRHGRKVALKVLRPALAAVVGADRFLAEIKTTANLQHPHILPLYDSGEADGFLFYVMPYIDGVSLRERLDREQQLPVDEAVRIATAVSHALDYAHRHGVIHRDVKPANILLQDGEPVVADFGIALAVQEAGGGRLTETGLSLGTPYYMSPEQATADRDPGPRSDVYSLGCVVYEMLTGEPPFSGRSAQSVVARILTDEPRRPGSLRDTVPAHVEAAVLRALRKIPADRFATAAQFADALNDPSFAVASAGFGEGAAPARAARGLWNPLSIGTTLLAAGLLALTVWNALQPEPQAAVRRYSLSLPDAQALQPDEPRPRIAISPDGARLIYVGPSESGIPRLWVRPRDQLDGSPLPGTEGATNPFFSPDGSRIGYVAHPTADQEQAVMLVSPGGGPPLALVDSLVGLDGVSWGSDGFIYYDGVTGGGTRGVMRVAAAGGSPEQVTVVDTARGETDHVWPRVLPGAKGLLFTVLRGEDLEVADVAVIDLESGDTRVLVRGVTARYSPSRYLLFVRADGTLAAVPFDADRMELRGEAVDLAKGLSVRLNGAVDLALSEDGSLVYIAGVQAPRPSELLWIDRGGRSSPLEEGWYGNFGSVALSPDGSKLAWSLMTGGYSGTQDVYIKELSSGATSRLSLVSPALNYRPDWTADGSSVTFVSDRAGQLDLYQRPADGTSPTELYLDGSGAISQAFHTRDGRWLVYVEDGDILGLRLDADSDPVPLVTTSAVETDPAVSPDGRWLAYSSDESGQVEVYVSPFPNTSEGRRTISAGGGFWPRFAHSGRELFYKTGTGQLVAVPVTEGGSLQVGESEVLFSVANLRGWRISNALEVAPDDQRFLVVQDRGSPNTSKLVVVEGFDQVLAERVR